MFLSSRVAKSGCFSRTMLRLRMAGTVPRRLASRSLSVSAASIHDDQKPLVFADHIKSGNSSDANKSFEEDYHLLVGDSQPDIDWKTLQELAGQEPTPLRLNDMYKYATGTDKAQRLRNAQFLHRELQIRVAQRAVDLLTLPHGSNRVPAIQKVAHLYVEYLQKFKNFPCPTNYEEEDEFTDFLQGIILDRTAVPMAISMGLSAWRDERQEDMELARLLEMENALNRFFTARVGLRFLTEHHVLSSPKRTQCELRLNQSTIEQPVMEGCIQTNCDPVREIEKVSASVRQQTLDFYGVCPDIEVVDCTERSRDFTYVPHHLDYMLVELLKNSCRATIKRHINDEGGLPPIKVVVVKGDEDVTIKIADKGGGIPRSSIPKLWKFAHSTADASENETDFGKDEVTGGKIRGFGLPLARIYARYFGGDLIVKTMEGYGVDAFLYLPRLGDACENLPLRVKASPGARDSMPTSNVRGIGRSRKYSTLAREPRWIVPNEDPLEITVAGGSMVWKGNELKEMLAALESRAL